MMKSKVRSTQIKWADFQRAPSVEELNLRRLRLRDQRHPSLPNEIEIRHVHGLHLPGPVRVPGRTQLET